MEINERVNEYMSTHVGHQNAVHAETVEQIFGISDRKLRKIVSELRKAGIPIASSRDGYWAAENNNEIKRTAALLNKHSAAVTDISTCLLYAQLPKTGHINISIDLE